jgi:hypothetical protein
MAATKLPFGVTRLTNDEGTRDYITCIPKERVFTQGIPAEAIVGILLQPLEPGESITPENFAANEVFLRFMQDIIARRGPLMPDLIATARRVREGPLYVIDQRTRAPETEVPETDVFGEFQVKKGRIIPGSYRPNSKHYLFSADGFFRLGPDLEDVLLEVLAAIPDPDDEGGDSTPPLVN